MFTHPSLRLSDGTLIPYYSAAYVQQRLEEAGATLLCIPAGRFSRPLMRQNRWAEIARLFGALEADAAPDMRRAWPTPSAARIAAMDEALPWLLLVGEEAPRKLTAARLLTHPVSGKPLYSWRKLAATTGVHRETLARWYLESCEEIATALTRAANRAA
jgi:hypothetical protein